jgi:aerobic-type carbon monoxide dehydrogenase small subunit (CoxS/CutS family)
VLVEAGPTRSCLMFGVQADDLYVVESLAENGELNALQQAFADAHGPQCGYCTPGFLMLASALLRENPDPTNEKIRAAMSANLCRCTG